jgi:hypothetical protein
MGIYMYPHTPSFQYDNVFCSRLLLHFTTPSSFP